MTPRSTVPKYHRNRISDGGALGAIKGEWGWWRSDLPKLSLIGRNATAEAVTMSVFCESVAGNAQEVQCLLKVRWELPLHGASTNRRAFFFNRSSRKTVFSHHSHTVCDYHQATTRPRRLVPVWSAKTTSAYAPGVMVKKIDEWIFSS
ncbi:hypothetical protein EVAR_103020_1 [Eumeta japonica]|uniref:Uncharacterized protein n=1 Tax=Eumeta variegata TaxID=151549 RepID=A0A4C1WEV2_EUMVA|nr:hypothetical protein EVAR_103020_1 [Eumeta japonica]